MLDHPVLPPAGPPDPPVRATRRRRVPRYTRRVPGGRAPRLTPSHPAPRVVRGWALPARVDPRLCDQLKVFPGLIVERISGFAGEEVWRQAVDGLFTAIRELAHHGPDCTGILAKITKEELRRRLKTEADFGPPVKAADGRIMRHRFLLIDDFVDQGLLLALVTGSGVKVDEEGRSPAMDWLAEKVREHTPCLVFAREWKRWGRNPWAFASLAHALRQLPHTLGEPAFGGDLDGLGQLDEAYEVRLFQAGAKGRREALDMRRASSGGSQEKTGREMVNGRVRFGSHVAAPPGLAKAHVRPGAFDAADRATGRKPRTEGRRGPVVQYLYIDEPASRPDPALVLSSRAPVGRTGEEPVNQAALVLWFFAHYAGTRPDGSVWDPIATADYLDREGYVSDGLRRTHPDQVVPAWTLGGKDRAEARRRARALCASMLRRIKEYRTGTFSFGLVGDDSPRAEITGIFPAIGCWLTDEDYSRIVAFEEGRAGPPRRGVRVFAGLPVTVDGGKGQLVASNRGPQRYFLAERQSARRVGTRAAPLPPLPHGFLVQTLVEGIARGDDLPQVAPPRVEANRELEDEKARLERQVKAIQAKLDNALAVAEEEKVVGQMAADMSDRYNVNARKLNKNKVKLDRVTRALDRATTAEPAGIDDSDLATLVPALADPWSGTARDLLAGHLTLDIRSFTTHEPGRPERTGLRVRGILPITNGERSFKIRLHGQYVATPRTNVDARVTAAVAGLRDGQTLSAVLKSDWRRYFPLVRQSLGLGDQQFRFAYVDDPRLLRLCMAVIHPQTTDPGPDPDSPRLGGSALHPSELTALARRLHEPVALLRRILSVHTQPAAKRRWLHDNSPVHATAYAKANRTGTVRRATLPSPDAALGVLEHGPFTDEWIIDRDRATLTACRTCGGSGRVPLRLREATGSVCRVCRTDRAGVVWPADYDRYRHRP